VDNRKIFRNIRKFSGKFDKSWSSTRLITELQAKTAKNVPDFLKTLRKGVLKPLDYGQTTKDYLEAIPREGLLQATASNFPNYFIKWPFIGDIWNYTVDDMAKNPEKYIIKSNYTVSRGKVLIDKTTGQIILPSPTEVPAELKTLLIEFQEYIKEIVSFSSKNTICRGGIIIDKKTGFPIKTVKGEIVQGGTTSVRVDPNAETPSMAEDRLKHNPPPTHDNPSNESQHEQYVKERFRNTSITDDQYNELLEEFYDPVTRINPDQRIIIPGRPALRGNVSSSQPLNHRQYYRSPNDEAIAA